MAPWELLDEKSESELHKTRLLNVEEKPFKRITKRLDAISSLVTAAKSGLREESDPQSPPIKTSQYLQDEVFFDFAAFDGNIARFQLLLNANQKERERYAADKQRIQEECQNVRQNNLKLRERLKEAREKLEQRKRFDELAEKILTNRLLRPREDQFTNLAKLEEECIELERESETYSATWKERREQFNKIVEEGMMLRRQIRDEKEEVDRREGMNEEDEEEVDGDKEDQTSHNPPSEQHTPHPEGHHRAKPSESGNATPQPASAAGTLNSPNDPTGLDHARSKLPQPLDGTQRLGSQEISTPASQAVDRDARGDVDMKDSEKSAREPGEDASKVEPEERDSQSLPQNDNSEDMDVDE